MEVRPQVPKEEWLFRRSYSSPIQNYCNPDGTATSRAFKLRAKINETELSVNVKSMTTAERAVSDRSKYLLFELPNAAVLAITDPQLCTYHDPIPDGSNNDHAVIAGMTLDDDITPGLLARASRKVSI